MGQTMRRRISKVTSSKAALPCSPLVISTGSHQHILTPNRASSIHHFRSSLENVDSDSAQGEFL